MQIAKTRGVKEALALAALVRETEGAAIGEIVGETGTGKTIAGRAVAAEMQALRVAAHEGMTRTQFLWRVAGAAGLDGPQGRLPEALSRWAGERSARPLLIVDEANKLRWQALETARYLSDECGFAVLLVGTELYERQFAAVRTRPLLLQLGRRIGAKRVRMGHLDRAETYAHVIRPRLGDIADRDLVTAFWHGCRRGNWGEAVELAEECARIMRAQEMATLTKAVLDAALAWTANRRDAGAGRGEGA